jgi:hypothetical protein
MMNMRKSTMRVLRMQKNITRSNIPNKKIFNKITIKIADIGAATCLMSFSHDRVCTLEYKLCWPEVFGPTVHDCTLHAQCTLSLIYFRHIVLLETHHTKTELYPEREF